ncbi:MAG: helix-turn-helix domain-containing protein [Rhodococcus sp.]|nr:helix-turn-helix domain-containing protein [Rhodococcus sp. (in: high G+C Gram-positive bacteria)]
MNTSAPLGDFLRSRRARARPADVGLPAGLGLRRTPGLRREELATLAGVSFDYYTRLEQGRERRPSRAVLDSLARALRLTADDREHLRHLATLTADPPAATASAPVTTVRPSIDALLTQLSPSPAYALNRVSDMVAANPEGLALFHGISSWPANRRNTVRYIFTHPLARDLFVDWDTTAQASVAQLRTMNERYPADPHLLELVAELSATDAAFRHLWADHTVGPRRHTTKAFDHPDLGAVAYDFETLHLPDGELRISVYTSTGRQASYS